MSPDTLSLDSKVAIVTGSGRENGIGAAIARSLARNGAAVTIHHVSNSSAPRAEKVAEQIRDAGGKATIVQANVNTLEGAKKIVAETLNAFGATHIDILGEYLAIQSFSGLVTDC
jgi:NAD(P)-dependent dehydrogenase (short-subunit alcohol dehydrogenase family)